MINHLVKGNGQGSFIARHHVGGRVAYQNNINSCFINQLGHAVIIGRKHGNLLTFQLHFRKNMSCNPLYFFVD
jgi:hypothetical protein